MDSSCDIEYFVDTHLCKLCVILRLLSHNVYFKVNVERSVFSMNEVARATGGGSLLYVLFQWFWLTRVYLFLQSSLKCLFFIFAV